MDHNPKLPFDEMKKLRNRFPEVDSRVNGLDPALGDRFRAVEATPLQLSVGQLGVDVAVADLITKLDAVDDIKLQTGVLTKHID